jgi:phosphatidylcholine synthase
LPRRLAAWCVHAFTASGAVVALITIVALGAGDVRLALGATVVAIVVDAIDGPLARLLSVATVLPSYDGRMLDWAIIPLPFAYPSRMISGRVPAYVLLAALALCMGAVAYLYPSGDVGLTAALVACGCALLALGPGIAVRSAARP